MAQAPSVSMMFRRIAGSNRGKIFFFLAAFVLLGSFSPAQTATVTFSGKVFDKRDSSATPAPIVVNKRTYTGSTGSMDGSFSITGLKTDTFIVTASGYELQRFCFRDSTAKDTFRLRIGLTIKSTTLQAVAIYPVKDLDAIKKERESLGVQQTYMTSGITDAVQSPITYMYERFSKEGKSKAMVAQYENQDRQEEVLKELFRTYVKAGVIDLDESEFDSFIAYLNMPESYLRTASDYDLAVTIRQKYLQYRAAQQFHDQIQR
ncbi:MAG TPA: hypothetical protein VFU15_09240 [Bacteroidia bacterium]|nr:hypothetical protein [Bacteroidia bacterium]